MSKETPFESRQQPSLEGNLRRPPILPILPLTEEDIKRAFDFVTSDGETVTAGDLAQRMKLFTTSQHNYRDLIGDNPAISLGELRSFLLQNEEWNSEKCIRDAFHMISDMEGVALDMQLLRGALEASLGEKLSHSDLRYVRKLADADGDGRVSMEDFLRIGNILPPDAEAILSQGAARSARAASQHEARRRAEYSLSCSANTSANLSATISATPSASSLAVPLSAGGTGTASSPSTPGGSSVASSGTSPGSASTALSIWSRVDPASAATAVFAPAPVAPSCLPPISPAMVEGPHMPPAPGREGSPPPGRTPSPARPSNPLSQPAASSVVHPALVLRPPHNSRPRAPLALPDLEPILSSRPAPEDIEVPLGRLPPVGRTPQPPQSPAPVPPARVPSPQMPRLESPSPAAAPAAPAAPTPVHASTATPGPPTGMISPWAELPPRPPAAGSHGRPESSPPRTPIERCLSPAVSAARDRLASALAAASFSFIPTPPPAPSPGGPRGLAARQAAARAGATASLRHSVAATSGAGLSLSLGLSGGDITSSGTRPRGSSSSVPSSPAPVSRAPSPGSAHRRGRGSSPAGSPPTGTASARSPMRRGSPLSDARPRRGAGMMVSVGVDTGELPAPEQLPPHERRFWTALPPDWSAAQPPGAGASLEGPGPWGPLTPSAATGGRPLLSPLAPLGPLSPIFVGPGPLETSSGVTTPSRGPLGESLDGSLLLTASRHEWRDPWEAVHLDSPEEAPGAAAPTDSQGIRSGAPSPPPAPGQDEVILFRPHQLARSTPTLRSAQFE
ncbi:hypothetical protein PAPYR_6466 [Paratrimastix pyriformis]|uniref:EF-hand domain-containing protein n=1 Tax=Paratrimastix pyriformis TaxID=342808 RepID=A0ABQ8UJQ5_9EUKA|nr:hypothetical protein PAPYR_6466 [Paratrimastix pyriformis]